MVFNDKDTLKNDTVKDCSNIVAVLKSKIFVKPAASQAVCSNKCPFEALH